MLTQHIHTNILTNTPFSFKCWLSPPLLWRVPGPFRSYKFFLPPLSNSVHSFFFIPQISVEHWHSSRSCEYSSDQTQCLLLVTLTQLYHLFYCNGVFWLLCLSSPLSRFTIGLGCPEWDVLRVYWILSQDKGSRLERLKGAQKKSWEKTALVISLFHT